jgi:hypothetical protein
MRQRIAVLILSAAALHAQADGDGNQLVTVPKRYVSAEGLTHQTESNVSKWVGVGREIGTATREGLAAVVDQAERFGSTKVGTFIMAMVAWRIIGQDVVRIVLGIPIWIAGVCLWIWSYRRMHVGYRAMARKEGKVKEWVQVEPHKFATNEGRSGSAWSHGIALGLWCAVWIPLIF